MNAPIRVRLTGWYVAVLAVVMALVVTFVVTRLRSDLTKEIDGSLRGAAAQIAQGYQAEGAQDFLDVAHTVLPGPRYRGSGAQVLDARGVVILSDGDPVTDQPILSRDEVRRAVAGKTLVRSVDRVNPNRHLRVVARPATRFGKRQALIVVESLAEVDRAVHRTLVLLVVGSLAALALVALGGWWIARKALRPVERMTTRADRIGIDDLSERIAGPRTRDEIGHLAATLNAMLDRLEEGVDARQRLVADASHELRAPLAAMRSEIDVSLRHDTLDPHARAILESARDEVVRMSRIVDNLLTLARVDAGRLELLTTPCELRALTADAVDAHRSAAEAAGVELVVEGEPVAALADRDRIHQVVVNLVDNAVRFAPRGTEVRVSTWRGDREGGIRVSDRGPGVSREAREHIFERFAREDPARGRSGGAGLGLAICRQIVEAHGGRIWFEDQPGGGACVVVALPLGAEPPADAADGAGRAGRERAGAAAVTARGAPPPRQPD